MAGRYSLKSVQVVKVQEKTELLLRTEGEKETQDTGQPRATCEPQLGPLTMKDIIATDGEL